jgi:ribonuclease J
MKITIHKGTNEIGGSCVELSTLNTTILLDYGTPLKEDSEQIIIDKPIDAILISHPHQDHFGEIANIDTSIPVYCGELAKELMNAAKIFTGNEPLQNNFHTYKAWKSFKIGDFTITPYLVDHSATDAYAFLIKADHQKVLYSGDFRANGRKSKLFDQMINDKHLKGVDVLLMEGTMLQRSNHDFPDEQSVEDKIYQTISQNNQITFMIGSSQNIDSIVSAYRACKKAGKIFVIDMYTAWILEKLKIVSSSIPNMNWKDVQVIKKFGGSYYQKIKENEEYFKNFKFDIFNNIAEIEDIKANPSCYFLKISPWHIDRLLNELESSDANIIYSQWLGYLKEEFSNSKTAELFKNFQEKYDWVYAHTSGHADLEALQKFASAINPKKLIPIHTEHKNKFASNFQNVMILEDNEVYNLWQNLSEFQVNELNRTFSDDLKD